MAEIKNINESWEGHYKGEVEEYIKRAGIAPAQQALAKRWGAAYFDAVTYRWLGFKDESDKAEYIASGDESLIVGEPVPFPFSGTVSQIEAELAKINLKLANIVETNEDGFYIIDPNYNIGFSVDADGVHGVDSPEIAPTAENTMNVLVIGNSYSTDSFAYLPDLCKVAGISAKIAVLYIGGRSLAQHVSGWDSTSYTYYKHIGGSSWSTSSSTIPNALANEKWDWIVTHQVSDSSGMYDTIADPLDTIIKNCINALDYPVKFAYLSTPAWGTQNTGWGDNYTDQADMFNKIVSAVQQVAKNHAIDTIIPVTAAIQNARQTSLQVYGADLFASTSDRHLEAGIARLVASYTVLLALAPRLLAKICSKEFLPSFSQVSSYPHTGSFTTVTLDMALIGQACAYAAIKYPYQTSVNQ